MCLTSTKIVWACWNLVKRIKQQRDLLSIKQQSQLCSIAVDLYDMFLLREKYHVLICMSDLFYEKSIVQEVERREAE